MLIQTYSFYFEIFSAQVNFSDPIGMMSADIFKRKMALAIQLKWIFLALKWAVLCLKNCVQFFQENNPCK
jgi:hypothetical protein